MRVTPQTNSPIPLQSQDTTSGPHASTLPGTLPYDRAPRLRLYPTTLRDANAFIRAYHRHSAAAVGCIAVVSVVDDEGRARGVGILGRPVARALADGTTAEITRVCTDGAPNACSQIYGALTRAARALGYLRVITYTHADESGSSLLAAGYHVAAAVRGRTWDTVSRRRDDGDCADKLRWERRP